METDQTCEACGSMVRKKRGRFCSKPCKDEAQRLPIGTVRIRRGPAGYMRAWIKCGDRKWRLRYHLVWEETHGPIPSKHVIHHVNGDTLDDRAENLEAVTRPQHVRTHRPWYEGEAARSAALRGWETRRRNAAIS